LHPHQRIPGQDSGGLQGVAAVPVVERRWRGEEVSGESGELGVSGHLSEEEEAALSNAAVLDALLARSPKSPTVCLKRRNMLDAYVSLFRAEHGEAPWQGGAGLPYQTYVESA